MLLHRSKRGFELLRPQIAEQFALSVKRINVNLPLVFCTLTG